MHLHYDKQLEFKTDLLYQALKNLPHTGYENYEIRPTGGMQEQNVTVLSTISDSKI